MWSHISERTGRREAPSSWRILHSRLGYRSLFISHFEESSRCTPSDSYRKRHIQDSRRNDISRNLFHQCSSSYGSRIFFPFGSLCQYGAWHIDRYGHHLLRRFLVDPSRWKDLFFIPDPFQSLRWLCSGIGEIQEDAWIMGQVAQWKMSLWLRQTLEELPWGIKLTPPRHIAGACSRCWIQHLIFTFRMIEHCKELQFRCVLFVECLLKRSLLHNVID